MRSTGMVRVPRKTKEQAMGVAAHLPGVSAGAVLAEALTLQLLVIASLEQLGLPDGDIDLEAQRLLTAYTDRVIATRLSVSGLSEKLAQDIEVEIEARALKMLEAAVPHHVAAALTNMGFPSDVSADGEVNMGEPKPQHLLEA